MHCPNQLSADLGGKLLSGMYKRDIQQTISKRCGSAQTFNRLIGALVTADRIEITPDKRIRLLPVTSPGNR